MIPAAVAVGRATEFALSLARLRRDLSICQHQAAECLFRAICRICQICANKADMSGSPPPSDAAHMRNRMALLGAEH